MKIPIINYSLLIESLRLINVGTVTQNGPQYFPQVTLIQLLYKRPFFSLNNGTSRVMPSIDSNSILNDE